MSEIKERLKQYIELHWVDESIDYMLAEDVSAIKPLHSIGSFRKQSANAMPLYGAAPGFVLDESFSEYLFRQIDERHEKDTDVYKRANLDRKLFSKIRRENYHVSKSTAIALAVALRMNKTEAKKLLEKAGYTLSESILADVIVSFFLEEGIYDLTKINEALLEYDQKLI